MAPKHERVPKVRAEDLIDSPDDDLTEEQWRQFIKHDPAWEKGVEEFVRAVDG